VLIDEPLDALKVLRRDLVTDETKHPPSEKSGLKVFLRILDEPRRPVVSAIGVNPALDFYQGAGIQVSEVSISARGEIYAPPRVVDRGPIAKPF
jgi:hypothetical protein